jgi:hypothetical protein
MAVGDVVALGVVRALSDAMDAEEWATYGSHLALDATHELVSQVTVVGRDNIVEHERTNSLPDRAITRDWVSPPTPPAGSGGVMTLGGPTLPLGLRDRPAGRRRLSW